LQLHAIGERLRGITAAGGITAILGPVGENEIRGADKYKQKQEDWREFHEAPLSDWLGVNIGVG
jgi:hypothetical protein